MKKQIYVVDVSSMFFRAFYAIRPLTSSKGVPVNAVYGFISMIIKLMKDKKPDHLVFCYDRKEPSFRKDLYVDYKANRTEMPDEMQVQMPYLKQIASLLGICDLEVPSYEADDLIGTIACMAQKEDYEVFIVSGDKDFCQLVNKNVFLYDTMKEIIFDEELVKAKHGVHPLQFIDYLALTGDSSDNIPGVAGIGPKGAQKLIEQFGTLEAIYENIDQISSASIKEKLLKSKDSAFLSKKLVTIVCDAPVSVTLEDFTLKPFKVDELRAFLQDLNFKTLEKNLLGEGKSGFVKPAESASEPPKASASLMAAVAPAAEQISVVVGQWNEAEIQKRLNQNENCFIFVAEEQIALGFQSELYFTSIAECKLNFTDLVWNGFDLKKVWTHLGIDSEKTLEVNWDLMLGSYVLRAADSSDPEKLADVFLQKELDLDSFESAADKLQNLYQTFLELNQKVQEELQSKELMIIYEKLERPLIPILYKMERKGIQLDLEYLKSFSEELAAELAGQEKKIHEISGEDFNIASPKQLGVVLFEKMGLEATKKTKTGYSTDNDVLEGLDHPIGKEIIHYREVAKLKSTYVDALPQLADSSARVHTHFNQALTTTGRLSSTNPNLQNIPIKTEKGQRVRKAFVASSGNRLLSVDYSQIELRVLAHISEDKGLIKAFQDDLDIHMATAAEVFSVPLNEVTKDQRRIAKAVNFGIAYGQGAFGLADTLGISRKESSEIIERYFSKFGGIKDYIEKTVKMAHEQKYVETLFGRRRYIPELDNKNVMMKKFGERAAINAPIQGTASDLVKMAMIELCSDLKIDMLLQVHDELIFEGTEEQIQMQLPWIVKTMENVVKLKVPLKVNYSVGNNWDEAH
ncbi:DNA polymerase I [Pseudobdellovibrio exovorus]|uniref:DNA polymerase I n=1 Tax=Pseudobdellovibrio exovorus JSS TaxID=1184267 RepID=M4VA87_9BACT|nr:DNA polymerase I [Pseudobdellovibrio exovorus]AGH94936.1 DNA polymerase I [Pseudobdellovibrio exovorus JSS]